MIEPPVGRGGDQFIPRPEMWRMGDQPAWLSVDPVAFGDLDRACEIVAQSPPGEYVLGTSFRRPATPGKQSAVLVALYPGDHGATLILTKRPMHMRTHAGEIAFPGGSVEPGDASLWETATREAHEEVGLDPELLTYVGELDRFVTGGSYSLVQPYVGRLDKPPNLVASPDEVALILETPLVEFLEPGVYRQELWEFGGYWVPMHFFELAGETIWGATALMLHNLLAIIG